MARRTRASDRSGRSGRSSSTLARRLLLDSLALWFASVVAMPRCHHKAAALLAADLAIVLATLC